MIQRVPASLPSDKSTCLDVNGSLSFLLSLAEENKAEKAERCSVNVIAWFPLFFGILQSRDSESRMKFMVGAARGGGV